MIGESTMVEAQDSNRMIELNLDQLDQVSGGVLPLLGVLGAVITFAPEIEAAVNGFFEAL